MSHSHQDSTNAIAGHQNQLREFLDGLVHRTLPLLDTYTDAIDKEVWEETNCLACANCCRNMAPAYTATDIKRIATYFKLSISAFKKKWLYQNKQGRWMSRLQPCPFLDLHTNGCTIYAIRPDDCAGFPHLAKKKLVDYTAMHKQNISYCPATVKMVEKLMQILPAGEE